MSEAGAKMRTHYDVLGITVAAPQEIVRAVYRAWMTALRAHPDLGGDEELAKALNAAYETLGDPARRAAYDATLPRSQEGQVEVTRRAARTKVDAEIAYCSVPEEGWQRARVMDASALGLRIRANANLIVGQNVAVALPAGIRHAVEARVRWVRTFDAFDEYLCEAGLEFFKPIPHILRRLGDKLP